MSRRFRNSFIAGMVLLSGFSASVHAASIWENTAGDNVLTNAANWSGDTLSSSSYLNIALAGSDRAVLSDGMRLIVNDVRVGINSESGLAGELEITGGFLRSDRGSGDTRLGYSGRTGTVNQSGGTWEVGQDLAIGLGGTGLYNLSGGVLDQQRGTFHVGESGTGQINITGGTLMTRGEARMYNAGTFHVEGTGAVSIGIGASNSGDGFWIQDAGGVLSVRIDDTPTGVTKTSIQGATGDVTFESGALLDVGFTGAFTNTGTFTLMEWDGNLVNKGLQFASGVDTAIWSFNVDAAGKRLTVTAREESTSASLLDTVVFGNSASEEEHAFVESDTEVVSGALGEPARRCNPLSSVDYYGGAMSFNMKVDPARRNYVTLKLWSNDDTTSDMGRLYLYVVEDATEYQVGFRHEGDYMPLSVPVDHPGIPDRFFYSTTMLPLEMTCGKTHMTLKVVSMGRLYTLGSGGEKDGGNYQFLMDTDSRGIYRAYTHVDPYLDVRGETQGTAPVASVRASPGEETLQYNGSFYTYVKDRINNRLSTAISTNSETFVSTYSPDDVSFLARSYSVSGLSGQPALPGYQNEAVVTKVVDLLDAFAKSYYEDNSRAQGWGGGYGALGQAIFYLQEYQDAQLFTSEILDEGVDMGVAGSKPRREAWGDMLFASREYGRLSNRRTISNQAILADGNIYAANKGLQGIADRRAFAEEVALRYVKEACGLFPWRGNDLPDSNGNGLPDDGSELPYGSNYYQVTAKGQTREWGYVGAGYGDLAYHVADWARMSGDSDILAQMTKMAKARAAFRRPTVEVDGSSHYKTMETVGLLSWRGAHESDGEFASYITYGSSANTGAGPKGLIAAARSGDPALMGYAKQMLEDHQYFAYLYSKYAKTSRALDLFDDYETVRDATDRGIRLPMTDGQPDFSWADEGNRILALKQGNDRLWVAPYWQAKTGTGINGVARFQYDTPDYTQYGVLETEPQFTPGGFFTRTTTDIDKPEGFQWTPPEPRPLQAYGGETLPLGSTPPDASSDAPFRGKADFYAFRFGRYLMGINASETKAYTLKTPVGFISATDLISGSTLRGNLVLAPTSSVALVLNDWIDDAPTPATPLVLRAHDSGTAVELEWSAASGAEAYVVKRAATPGGPYSVVVSNISTTVYADPDGESSDHYVVVAVNANGESDASMESVMTSVLRAPWMHTDIGAPEGAGNASYFNGAYTVSGAGSDIGGGLDELHFAYLSLGGDGMFTARMTSMNGATSGKVGLMIRESTEANSKVAAFLVDKGGDNVRLPIRSSTGGNMNWSDADGPAISGFPLWLRWVRSGNTFTGYTSADGATWTEAVSRSVSLNSTVLVGLAVCSRADPQVNTTTFDHVSLSGWSLSSQECWRFEHFGSYTDAENGADYADPDRDFRSNLLEYGVGSDPNSFDQEAASALGFTTDGSRMMLRFDRISDPALTYWVEGASNLVSNEWTTVWMSSGASNTNGPVTVDDTELISHHGARFLRLKLKN